MDVVLDKTIKQRRSIRRYTKQMLRENEIYKIIEAAIWAPSGLNNQPWKFKILSGNQKNKLAKFTKYVHVIEAAPVAICIFLDNSLTYNRDKDIMSVGACIQNMLLKAHAMGYGTCWLGEILNKREGVEGYLKVSSDCELMAVVTLGYSDEKNKKGSRHKLKSFILN